MATKKVAAAPKPAAKTTKPAVKTKKQIESEELAKIRASLPPKDVKREDVTDVAKAMTEFRQGLSKARYF